MTFQVQWISAVVIEVNGPWATVKDSYGIIRQVRIDFRRAGRHPKPGEQWLLDRSLNDWTFAALYSPDDAKLDEISDVKIEGPVVGHVITYDGDDWVNAPPGGVEGIEIPGLIPGEPIYYTTTGAHTFTKAEYPGAVAFQIECQGGGGGGGGCVATGAGAISAGGGGGGGGYGKSIVQATELDVTEAITVGAGGTGVTGATGNTGVDSFFDTIPSEIRGTGGVGGASGSAVAPPVAVLGGAGGSANVGEYVRGGDDGERGLYLAASTTTRAGGAGGASFLGGSKGTIASGSSAGSAGRAYGGGGSGAHNQPSDGTARAGGAGAAGIVIVTPLYPVTGGIVGVGAPGVGLIWGGTLYFDANDTFDKSDFLGIKGIIVECQGGGGGGGGGATAAATQVSLGGGGAGGGYARRWIPVTSLAASEAITVGAGGSAGPASSAAAGNGGNSSFGTHCVGLGAAGGTGSASQAVPTTAPTNPPAGPGGTGDLVIPGTAGQQGFATGGGTAQGFGSSGGHSHLGAGGRAVRTGGSTPGGGQAGVDGNLYGGGGAGAVIINGQTGAAGGDGARGRVMVHLYYASGGEGGSPPAGGYFEGDPIYYKTTGAHTFTKADYPGARAFKIECQGAGGGSGGAGATTAGEASIGGGGGGGGYARSIVPYDDLAPTEAITVGAGGTAGAAAAGNGGDGGDSVFDTISSEVRGRGASGGGGSTTFAPLSGVPGGAASSQTGNVGDFTMDGGDSVQGFSLAATRNYPSVGGASFLSNHQTRSLVGSGQQGGSTGKEYGGGAMGAVNSQSQSAIAGAAGGPGIVIVTPLY